MTISKTALALGLTLLAQPAFALSLTDSTVFSTNESGHNWLGWIWNTRGADTDAANRWNMYYSTSSDPSAPSFVNSGNDSATEIDIALTAGVYDFVIFGEQTGADTTHPALHFVTNLYFDDNSTAPGISGLTGPTCATVCAASHANGLDLFGNAGAAEAGTLSYSSGGTTVTLTEFSWTATDIDRVWQTYAGAYNGNYSGTPDFVGTLQLTVSEVPLPAAGWLLAGGLGAFGLLRRRKG